MEGLKLKEGYDKAMVDLKGYYFTMVKNRIYKLSEEDAKYILSKYSDCVEEVKPNKGKIKTIKPKKVKKEEDTKKEETINQENKEE